MFLKRWMYVAGFLPFMLVRPAYAEKELLVSPKLGFSAFTGILGLEVQYKHLALDIGIPAAGGVRYYGNPNGHSWFAGLYGMGFGYDHDETIDGVMYTHYSMIQGGAAAGYRWLWRSRWSLELGLGLGEGTQHWTNSRFEKTQQTIFLWPVAALGIAF